MQYCVKDSDNPKKSEFCLVTMRDTMDDIATSGRISWNILAR